MSNGGNDYTTVRRTVALLLSAFLGLILVIDAFSVDYAVDPVVTGSLLGAIVAVIGVDLSKRFAAKPDESEVERIQQVWSKQAKTEAARVEASLAATEAERVAAEAAETSRKATEAADIAAVAAREARAKVPKP